MTLRQREVAQGMSTNHPGAFSGPYQALLHSPEVAARVHRLGEFMRFGLHVPERLRVLAVLVAAGRHRASDLDAFIDLASTRESGLDPGTIEELREGRAPTALAEDEAIVYAYCSELIRKRRISEATFERAVARFGREVCLELVEVCGFAAFITMLVNVTQTSFAKDDS